MKKDRVVKRKDALITPGLLIPISQGPANPKMLVYEFAATRQHPRLEASTTQTDFRLWRLSAQEPGAGRLGTPKPRLLGVETAVSSLGPHAAIPLGVSVSASLLVRLLIGPKLITSSYLHYFLKAPSPITVTF